MHIDVTKGQAPQDESDWLNEELAENEPDNRWEDEQPTVVAIDLKEMRPIIGVKSLQMSFLDPRANQTIASLIPISRRRPRVEVDLVLSDMSPNITGNRAHDDEASMELNDAVLEFADAYLRRHNERGEHGSVRGGSLL